MYIILLILDKSYIVKHEFCNTKCYKLSSIKVAPPVAADQWASQSITAEVHMVFNPQLPSPR